MSAIFGRFRFDEQPLASSTLRAMQEAMSDWERDGEGLWLEGSVGLGCLRRDNTPESVGETLPWLCPASGDVITASARLDNREELQEALSIPPPERAAMSDSRLMLEAYHRWGPACADRMLGDWSCAIWDARERKLFLARDPHGITGLYYYADSSGFTFSSSVKGLLALPEVPRRPNPLVIAQILTSWTAEGAPTCYEGILRLPPAHAMTVTPEAIRVERYWDLEQTPDLRLSTDDEYVDAFLEIYDEAVRCRLRCSEPVGLALSGGLDSGSVAALAGRELGKRGERLAAFSSVPIAPTEWVNGGQLGDETPLIEATARFVGNIDVHYIHARDVSPVAAYERALSIHDHLPPAAGNTHWILALMEEARRQGLGAVLTGQGGNSTISWTGGRPAPLLDYLVRAQWGTFRKRFQAWKQATGRSSWQGVRSQVIRPLLAPLRRRRSRWKDATEPWRDYSAINVAFARELDLTDRMRQQGHDPHFAGGGDPRRLRSSLIRPGRSVLGHIWLELGGAHGLEVRDPTFDRRVMSFCWSIPEGQFLRGDQHRLLIRRAMSGLLPDQVRLNRRMGLQAADRAQRVVDHRNDVEAALARLERSELARHYLDLPRMRRIFESVQHGINRENTFETQMVLQRGLIAGLFLLRFE